MKPMIAILSMILAYSLTGHAQSVEINESGSSNPPSSETGRDKAQQYFQSRKSTAASAPVQPSGAAPHYLAVHFGTYFSDQAYNWGNEDIRSNGGWGSGAGKFNGGVTYRFGEWVNSMDLSLRMEYTSYDLGEAGSARKLSFSPVITFPDASSRFPLYFGGGAGLGLFVQQARGRSPVSFDWQVLAGVRFLDVIGKVGFMVETGLKSHIFILSQGQYNGVYLNVGSVFAF